MSKTYKEKGEGFQIFLEMQLKSVIDLFKKGDIKTLIEQGKDLPKLESEFKNYEKSLHIKGIDELIMKLI